MTLSILTSFFVSGVKAPWFEAHNWAKKWVGSVLHHRSFSSLVQE